MRVLVWNGPWDLTVANREDPDFRETAEWVGTAPDVLARLVDGRVDMAGR